MADRFFSLNTSDLRGMLDRAWELAPSGANTLLEQLKQCERDSTEIASENIFSSSSNGHSASAYTPGSNSPASIEYQRGWRRLVDLYINYRSFLFRCSQYGLDAFGVVKSTGFPAGIPKVSPVIIVDKFGNWAELCDKYQVDPSLVVGAPVGDESVYMWMMDNLFPVTEARPDYSQSIVARGGSWL